MLFDCLQNKWAHLDAWYQPKPRFDRLEIMRFFCSTRYISKMHFFMVIFLFINRPPKTELYLIGPKLSFGLELDYYFSIAMVWLTTYKCYGRSNLLFRSEICFHIFFPNDNSSAWNLPTVFVELKEEVFRDFLKWLLKNSNWKAEVDGFHQCNYVALMSFYFLFLYRVSTSSLALFSSFIYS